MRLRHGPTRFACAALFLCAALSACATPPPPPSLIPITTPEPHPAASSSPSASPAADPPLAHEKARALVTAWQLAWSKLPDRYDHDIDAAVAAANGIDESLVRRVLTALTRDCLAERSRETPACGILGPSSHADLGVDIAVALAGEVADVRVGDSETLRLLIRLEARGESAGHAIDRALERRWLAHQKGCAPPTKEEVARARARLSDVRIRVLKGSPRSATEVELDDLAYLRASVEGAGLEVGTAMEDEASPPLPKGSPELARREAQRKAMQDALLDGDLERHASAAEAYLKMLGYPGPIRVAEDEAEPFGGKWFTYTLYRWARTAEILGRFDVAEPLHRRAVPGGAPPGTYSPSAFTDQMKAAIRVAEQREGCRPVVAERLFVPNSRTTDIYGPATLQSSGFDLLRLYRAALLDTGEGHAFASRIRAIAGYADVGGRDAAQRLPDMAEHGTVENRVEAIRALGGMLRSFGQPCQSERVGSGDEGLGEREVGSIMTFCEGKLDDKVRDKIVQRMAALARDPEWRVREAVAKMLGGTAAPGARALLEKLARDKYEDGNTLCTTLDDGTERCEPNRPVKSAAQEAITSFSAAEETRREQDKENGAKK